MENGESIFAPAKLTLTLRMLDKREDGFNNLEALTVFLPDVYDQLQIVLRNPGDEILSIYKADGSPSDLPNDETNLVIKALKLFASDSRVQIPREEIDQIGFKLVKNLPSAAGLGGGSSDAAATLRLLNERFGLPLTEMELADLSSEIGSDIPACVYSRALWMRGRGEIVDPIDRFNADGLNILVFTPELQCSTPAVFARYDEIARPVDVGVQAPERLKRFSSNLHNDLALGAFDLFPELTQLRNDLEQATSMQFRLAGSGSTLFAIGTAEEIEKAMQKVRDFSSRLCAVSRII